MSLLYNIISIRALKDNYIWAITNQEQGICICIAPGEAKPVRNFLEEHSLSLNAILVTHHHFDHTDGIHELYDLYSPNIFAPSKKIHPDAIEVIDGAAYNLLSSHPLYAKVIATPGHTLDHVCYYINQHLFTGDTLFFGGCGRVFEGSYGMMYASLNKLLALDDDTLIYCGHEYTKNNLEFAKTIEPDNPYIAQQLAKISRSSKDHVTPPSTIGLEKKLNPFLRVENSAIMHNIALSTKSGSTDPIEVFAAIRELKDKFK